MMVTPSSYFRTRLEKFAYRLFRKLFDKIYSYGYMDGYENPPKGF